MIDCAIWMVGFKVNLEEEINVEEVVEVEVIDINVEVVEVKICIGKDAHVIWYARSTPWQRTFVHESFHMLQICESQP
jgi:hypothetical protein